MTTKQPKGWQPGQSGNPKGKPPGSGELQRLRATIAAEVPEILAKLVQAAKAGDIQAARLVLERVLPPIKATEQSAPITLPIDGTLTAKATAVLAATAAGQLAPGQAAQFMAALSAMAKIAEVDELETRITKLENQNGRT